MQFREITLRDTPNIFELRIATNEQNFTYEELEARGITHRLLDSKLLGSCKGWLCQQNNEVIGFVIADKTIAGIWALAVLPGPNKKHIEARLIQLADHWLLSIGRKRLNNSPKKNQKTNTPALA